jgi:ribose/xylose/arabinose/galactoside ABC-type transport system permease subunit
MRGDLRQKLVRLGPFVGLVLVVGFFALASGAPERYLSANNLRVVLAQTVIVAIGAIGMTLVIVPWPFATAGRPRSRSWPRSSPGAWSAS